MDTVRLDTADNVVTATRALQVGVPIEDTETRSMIPKGHKIATRKIAQGEAVRKYAQVIGYASADIEAGAHVHTHNVAFRNTDMEYEYATDLRPVTPDFHARSSATGKQYRYLIWNHPECPEERRGRVWHIPGPLDVEAMRRAWHGAGVSADVAVVDIDRMGVVLE